MPIRVPDNLPAREILKEEHVFFIGETQADEQDIRPLEIAIFNLMPNKIRTEAQLIRTLSYSPLQINVTLLRTQSYKSKNTPAEHLEAFYKTYDEVKEKKYDGIIVTGAPVETMPFEDVQYWDEFKEILNWSETNVFASIFICWGAQAALHHFHGLEKTILPVKKFGVFQQDTINSRHVLMRGYDDQFFVPVSRHTQIELADIRKIDALEILAESEETGACLIHEKANRRTYIFDHPEYDPNTLKEEYERDLDAGRAPTIPLNYFKDNNPNQEPYVLWRSHRNLLFSNWVNMVYQNTPYDLKKVGQ